MNLWKILYFLVALVAIVYTFAAPDAKSFAEPGLARIIFYHLPCAIITTVFLFVGAFFSLKFLRTRDWKWEVRAVSAQELGFLFAVLAMITGILFSKVQWGAWWQWDPRQTSFLMVLLLFAAYFALRLAFQDEVKRAVYGAAYAVAGLLPAIFLIFVFPRLPQVVKVSFHPSQTVATGGFDNNYRLGLLGTFIVLGVAGAWLYRLRVRAGLLEYESESFNAALDDRGDSAAPRVVRPVSLSPESGGDRQER